MVIHGSYAWPLQFSFADWLEWGFAVPLVSRSPGITVGWVHRPTVRDDECGDRPVTSLSWIDTTPKLRRYHGRDGAPSGKREISRGFSHLPDLRALRSCVIRLHRLRWKCRRIVQQMWVTIIMDGKKKKFYLAKTERCTRIKIHIAQLAEKISLVWNCTKDFESYINKQCRVL